MNEWNSYNDKVYLTNTADPISSPSEYLKQQWCLYYQKLWGSKHSSETKDWTIESIANEYSERAHLLSITPIWETPEYQAYTYYYNLQDRHVLTHLIYPHKNRVNTSIVSEYLQKEGGRLDTDLYRLMSKNYTSLQQFVIDNPDETETILQLNRSVIRERTIPEYHSIVKNYLTQVYEYHNALEKVIDPTVWNQFLSC